MRHHLSITVTLAILLIVVAPGDRHASRALAARPETAGSRPSVANGVLAGMLVLPHALIEALTALPDGRTLLVGGTYMVPTSDAAAPIPAYPAGSEWAISHSSVDTPEERHTAP